MHQLSPTVSDLLVQMLKLHLQNIALFCLAVHITAFNCIVYLMHKVKFSQNFNKTV